MDTEKIEPPQTMSAGLLTGITAGALGPWVAWNWEMLYEGKLLQMPDSVATTVGLLLLVLVGMIHKMAVRKQ
jgi:hypothetical protein